MLPVVGFDTLLDGRVLARLTAAGAATLGYPGNPPIHQKESK